MHFWFQRFVLIWALTATLSAAQKNTKAKTNPPAIPQAKTSQPATHFTQGTITSIDANQIVITRKVRGKAEQKSFAINSQTQVFGSVITGTRVSVQYRDADNQSIAAAVRELPKPRPKS